MDFFPACDQMAAMVQEQIRDMVGTPGAGEIIGMGADHTPTKKIDLVAEDCIIRFLEENPLCSLLISEEAGTVAFGGERGTIYLDPVDGTFNAVSGIPFFALSIAYARDGIMQAAFVRDLASGETFTAEKGNGAWCDGKPARVSDVSRLDTCAMSVYGRKFDPSRAMQLGQKIRRWRLLGASALELCYVGCGRIDGFVDLRGTLRVTDAAAGMLICTEGGGTVTGPGGEEVRFPDDVTAGRCLAATNGILHPKVIEYLR